MEELLEQAVNAPQVHYILENPGIVASKASVASIVGVAASGLAGQMQGSREIENLLQNHDQEDYEDILLSRKEELAEDIKRDSALREIYNHIRHAYKSGKLDTFEQKEKNVKGTDFGDKGDEYYRQRFTDDDLEYLD